MNNKIWYWVIGVLAAIIIITLIVSATRSDRSDVPPVSSNIDHAGMDHGPIESTPEDSDFGGYLQEQDDIMTRMMQEMQMVGASGSAEVSFLAGMLPHHRAAVEMAQSYLRYAGEDARFSGLAHTVIDTQNEEIGLMGEMIEALNTQGLRDEARETAYLTAYDKLFDGHAMMHVTADNLDSAFAEGMLMHHQMAVDMAKAVLGHTDEQTVIDLAQSIITTQEQEITEMQAFLDGDASSAL